jgi:hypothetical protein
MERELPTEGARIFVTSPQTGVRIVFSKRILYTPSGTESKKIIVHRRFALETEAKHAAMNTAQGCHRARPAPTKRPCPSNLIPSSLSMRSFQSQWDTGDRLLDPGLCFSPQNPPIVRFEAMILWHGMNGAKGLFARAVPTKNTSAW